LACNRAARFSRAHVPAAADDVAGYGLQRRLAGNRRTINGRKNRQYSGPPPLPAYDIAQSTNPVAR